MKILTIVQCFRFGGNEHGLKEKITKIMAVGERRVQIDPQMVIFSRLVWTKRYENQYKSLLVFPARATQS